MTLRLMADDLTGALDTAAEFTGLFGPVPVYWAEGIPANLPQSAAWDAATRELSEPAAVATVRELARHLEPGSIAYKKVDSLMRGHAVAELAACFGSGFWRHCVVAPAFPYQLRITHERRQLVRHGADWVPVSGDLVAGLQALGLSARAGECTGELTRGISVFDAQTQEDLDRIADFARSAEGRVLWCGSGGLAHALSRESPPLTSTVLVPPVLGLFGSDHVITARQLTACGPASLKLADGGPSAAQVRDQLATTGVALVSFELRSGIGRAAAAEEIGCRIDALTRRLAAPATLIVAGGETLRALCRSVGASALQVHGHIEPGVPRSRLQGGRWDGVEVVSKSGAFGRADLWRNLLERNGLGPGPVSNGGRSLVRRADPTQVPGPAPRDSK
jgi:D-threonate/D-erythronate kinase